MKNNFIEEVFETRVARDERWEGLMLTKPHVVRDTTSENGRIVWRVRYPNFVE
jgi:hypothetical protein